MGIEIETDGLTKPGGIDMRWLIRRYGYRYSPKHLIPWQQVEE